MQQPHPKPEASASAPATDVAAVALKLPTIWTDDVEGWFTHVESQFAIRKINAEATKYHYVVAALDSSVSSRVRSVLRRGHADYEALKDALVDRYALSRSERAEQIRAITSLNGSRPSEVMDRMLLLLRDEAPGLLFIHHFLSVLPDYVRNVLAYSEERDPSRLAAEADRIYAAGRPSHALDAVVENDGSEVNSIRRRRDNARPPTRRPQNADGLCYYHKTFGDRAIKCTCKGSDSYEGNGSRGRRQ